jgi:hypothetical protein
MSAVTREVSAELIEIVPGVMGVQWIRDDRGAIPSPSGNIRVEVYIRFEPELHRYICRAFTARGPVGRPVTTEVLRQARTGDWINMALMKTTVLDAEQQPIREVANPDGREPWGLTPPDGITAGGPTDRALQWVAHVYRYGYAVSFNPTKAVQETLKLPRSTAGRWIAAAREAGYLGPSEGMGKAGG